jgi:hypothetical protein
VFEDRPAKPQLHGKISSSTSQLTTLPLPPPSPPNKTRPSFNGALAEGAQGLCVMNTVVALLGACLAGFSASSLFGNQLNMVHIQNATLAGGVAIGSSANLRMPPAASLAGGLGVWGRRMRVG